MTILYTICAILGGTVLLCQFFLSITGISDADDLDDGSHVDASVDHVDAAQHDVHHHGPNWFFSVISLRTVTAALTFFGLTGLALQAGGTPSTTSLAAAVGAGVAALYLVHWLMRSLAL